MTETPEIDVAQASPERFDPSAMQGRLIEAEHVARYDWATELVPGKRVLDAGCGTGYGSNILARAGADEVVAVDIDGPTVERARNAAENVVTLCVADLHRLSFDDASFDVVVCFEVLEHVEEPETVLDELARVLQPGGVLVVSSPNPDVYPAGNPHHVHEFHRRELAETLGTRFEHIRVVRQHAWLASSLVDDDQLEAEDGFVVRARSALADAEGKELYSVALASEHELPQVPPQLVLTDTTDLKWWQDRLADLQDDLRASRRRAAEAEEDSRVERTKAREAAAQLVSTERDLAQQLERRAVVESELADSRDELRQREAELEERSRQVTEVQATRVWRIAGRYWRVRDRTKKLLRPGRARSSSSSTES
jgi:2-polyprenyl-3-methyl-5-hydroxy-6-metoxy-1,4-benzoquinol methylase